MGFSVEWQDPGVSSSSELRATFCLLGIDVGGSCVSRFFDERYSRAHDRIAMPAYPPAQGIARFWWPLMAGRSGIFLLRRFRDGFALPDVRFEPDGRFVDIQVEPFEYENPHVTFVRRARERIGVDEFQRNMAEFVESVIEKLSDSKVKNTWLEERWSHIQDSLEDDEERLFCEAAGAAGIDPYTCTDAEAGSIEAVGEFFEGDALQEFLASQKNQHTAETLDWLRSAEAQVGDNAALPDIADLKKGVQEKGAAPVSASERPWKIGYAIADQCRKAINLREDRIFGDVTDIAKLFGARNFHIASGRIPGLRAEVRNGGHAPKVIVAELPDPRGQNFAMMRAIGDYLAFDLRERAPITDTYSYRQAVGRAFAVEMLAPAETILEMERTGMKADEIAARRNVSEDAIAHHLENHRALQTA
ncbi:MAG TPA: hypothetical protein VHX61_20600 [Rhizomicrobium sp.]|jgi:hypothetical protein|nr:hypothetical protein [Rhizomicrobium sp.]